LLGAGDAAADEAAAAAAGAAADMDADEVPDAAADPDAATAAAEAAALAEDAEAAAAAAAAAEAAFEGDDRESGSDLLSYGDSEYDDYGSSDAEEVDWKVRGSCCLHAWGGPLHMAPLHMTRGRRCAEGASVGGLRGMPMASGRLPCTGACPDCWRPGHLTC
jgi:hypothetical protein